MVKLVVVTREGEERVIEANGNISVMEAIRDDGIDELLALCGGSMSCATCHVYVDPAHEDIAVPQSEDEVELLDSSGYRQPNSRLSCQIRVAKLPDGFKVTIAPED